MSQMHYFCLLDESCLCLEPSNNLPLFTQLPRRLILGNSRHTRRAGAVRLRPFPFRVVRCYRTNLRASRATATTIAVSIINFLNLTYLLLLESLFSCQRLIL